MYKILLTALLCLLPALSQAQTSPNPTPIDVPTLLNGVTLDSGVGWDLKNKQWTSVSTIKFLEYNKTDRTGKYSTFLNYIGHIDPSASVGYSTTDKLVVGLSFTLVNPAMLGLNSPLLNYLTIKPFAFYSFYHIGANLSNIKNSWILGAYLVQIKI